MKHKNLFILKISFFLFLILSLGMIFILIREATVYAEASARYWASPNKADNTLQAPENVMLPVLLDWPDMKCWHPGPRCECACPVLGPATSYQLQIDSTTRGFYEITLPPISEYNPTINNDCLLKSNFTHSWRVRPCCPCTCTHWREYLFTTNTTPELLSPADPDWAGPKYAEGVKALPITPIQWCNTITVDTWPKGPRIDPLGDDPPYYQYQRLLEDRPELLPYKNMEFPILIWNLLPFLVKDGQKQCHPDFVEHGVCVPLRINLYDGKVPIYGKPERLEGQKAEIITFNEHLGVFTRETQYKFQIQACWDRHIPGPPQIEGGRICSDFGQRWKLKTRDDPLHSFSLILPDNDPQGERPIGTPVTLRWTKPYGTESFRIYLNNIRLILDNPRTTLITLNYRDPLFLNTLYSWRVEPCWDFKAEKCKEDAHFLAGPWYFKTTGASPKLVHPKGNDIPIPVTFRWQPVGGSESYVFKLVQKQPWKELKRKVTVDTEVLVKYPLLTQETDYLWMVKSCDEEDGTNCGVWSLHPFTTFRLSTPEFEVNPKQVFFTRIGARFLWEEVPHAKYYKYKVISENNIIKEGITPHSNILITLPYLKKLNANNILKVKGCLDENCYHYGDYYELSFTIAEEKVPDRPPLVPCGLAFDHPDTLWDEREACQIKHFPIILQAIINFFLWELIPLLLVLLTLATGAIFYFSIGGKKTIPLIKRIWRAFGIGLGIIFFAWLIVSFILALFGYQVGIFGVWYRVVN